MQFNQAITNIIEAFIEAWNSEEYSFISDTLVDNIIIKTEAIDLENMQVPAVETMGILQAITYWKSMKVSFNVAIEKYEIIKMGRNSEIICHYKDLNLTMLAKVNINEYGKATEIINRLHEPT